MNTTVSNLERSTPLNASIIFDEADPSFLIAALDQLGSANCALIVSNDPKFLLNIPKQFRMDFTGAGLDDVPIKLAEVKDRIGAVRQSQETVSMIIVDMRWGLRTVAAAANFERWGGLCDRIVDETSIPVVSVYGRSLMIEDQLIAAMRGHSHFLAPSGNYPNPFWLPPEYQSGATISQQIGFVLGRLVPDYEGLASHDSFEDGAASGANPNWISAPRRIRPRVGKDEIWKIRCFGRLRVYLSDGTQVKWDIRGSAPKKSKVLFAYLLQCRERGARTDLLAELLWSDELDETKRRKRLYHAVAMLRKTLGGSEFIERAGDYYILVPPAGTWIDIANFEQLCNRAKVLSKANNLEDAITLLDAADRLYCGELFEDLGFEYLENELENWVVPKRTWFKDMALKVLRDKAEILRLQGQYRDALESCQKALEMDTTCTIAHAESMRIFHAQKRGDAITRQYRQFLTEMETIGATPVSSELENLYEGLLKTV